MTATTTSEVPPAAQSAVPLATLAPRSLKQLASAVKLDSPKLVEEVWKIAQRQFDLETARRARIESKAASLLTACGATLSFAFSLGLPALIKRHEMHALTGGWWKLAALLVVIAVLVGLGATWCAVDALRARKTWPSLNEDTVFERLSMYDANAKGECDQAVTKYRRYVLPELWEMARLQAAAAEEKATMLGRGQLALFAFVCIAAIVSLGALLL